MSQTAAPHLSAPGLAVDNAPALGALRPDIEMPALPAHLRLNSRPDLEDQLLTIKGYICGQENIKGKGFWDRYGPLTIIARKTPVHLYDHPSLAGLCQTAMTDGVNLWVYVPFFLDLLEEQRQGKAIILELMLHEYSHILLQHCGRLLQYSKEARAYATDAVINPKVAQLTQPTNPSELWTRAPGIRPEDKRFEGLSEETIAKILMQEQSAKGVLTIKKLVIKDAPPGATSSPKPQQRQTLTIPPGGMQLDELEITVGPDGSSDTEVDGRVVIEQIDDQRMNPPKANQDPSQQDGAAGNGAQGEQSPVGKRVTAAKGSSAGTGRSKLASGKQAPGAAEGAKGMTQEQAKRLLNPAGGWGNDHNVAMEEIYNALKRHGMDHVIDSVRIPKPGEETERAMDDAELRAIGALQEALRDRARMQDPNEYPGGHIADYAVETINGFYRLNASWKMRVREFVLGNGRLVNRDFDVPGHIYYVDPQHMNMPIGHSVFMPGMVPVRSEAKVKFILDTSGSVDNERLRAYISLILDLMQQADQYSPTIEVYSADTIIRGKPQIITEENLQAYVEGGLAVAGRGGTDFTNPLRMVLDLAEKEEEEIAAIVYATDFCAFEPNWSALPPPTEMPPLMFVGIPADFASSEQFVNAVRHRAEVVPIEDGMILDFEAAQDKSEAPRAAGLRP